MGDLSHLSLMGACKDSLWIEGGWVSLQAYQPQETNNSTSTANLTTFYSAKREEPTPYATTSIINNKVRYLLFLLSILICLEMLEGFFLEDIDSLLPIMENIFK